MAPVNFDDLSYIQMLNTMNNRINDALNNSDDQGQNTVMQYFEAPLDQFTLSSVVLSTLSVDPNANIVWGASAGWTWGNGGVYDPVSNISSSASDTFTLSATVQTFASFVANLAWGSSSVTPNWSWNIGAVWQ